MGLYVVAALVVVIGAWIYWVYKRNRLAVRVFKPDASQHAAAEAKRADRANAIRQQTTTHAQLIPCQTCQHLIGPQAETCPQCGSPNTWMHPRIKAMYETKSFDTSRGFQYQHKGAVVWGESVYHSPLAVVGVLLLIAIGVLSLLFVGVFGPAISGVLCVVFWRATAKKETFKADLLKQEWTSSNDKFWSPVQVFLLL